MKISHYHSSVLERIRHGLRRNTQLSVTLMVFTLSYMILGVEILGELSESDGAYRMTILTFAYFSTLPTIVGFCLNSIAYVAFSPKTKGQPTVKSIVDSSTKKQVFIVSALVSMWFATVMTKDNASMLTQWLTTYVNNWDSYGPYKYAELATTYIATAICFAVIALGVASIHSFRQCQMVCSWKLTKGVVVNEALSGCPFLLKSVLVTLVSALLIGNPFLALTLGLTSWVFFLGASIITVRIRMQDKAAE